jgi:hypothetical protein
VVLSNIIGINCYDGLYYNFILSGLTGSQTFTTGSTYHIEGVLDDGRTINTCIEIYDTYSGDTYSGVRIQDIFVLDDPVSFLEYNTGVNECFQCTTNNLSQDLPVNRSGPAEAYPALMNECNGNNVASGISVGINVDYYDNEILGSVLTYYYTGYSPNEVCYVLYTVDTSEGTFPAEDFDIYIASNELFTETCCIEPTVTPTPTPPPPVNPEGEASDCYLYEITNNGNTGGTVTYIPCGGTITGVTVDPNDSIIVCSSEGPVFINEGFDEFGIVKYSFVVPSNELNSPPPVISYDETQGTVPDNVDISLAAGQITFNQPIGETDTSFGPVTFRVEGSVYCNTLLGGCGSIDVYLYKEGDTQPTLIFTVNLLSDDTTTFSEEHTVTTLDYGSYNMLYVSGNNMVSYDYLKFLVEQSETFVDISSTNIGACQTTDVCDFTYSVTGSSSCSDTGIVTITGTTGVGPFTFTWSNGQTGTTVTNLPPGNITVTMSDAGSDCVDVLKTITVPTVSGLSIKNLTSTRANCFNCDGTISLEVQGGTSPFYFSASTGQSSEVFIEDTTYTFTGLCQGNVNIKITDSGGCILNTTEYINSTSQISLNSITTNSSLCNDSGEIIISTSGYFGLRTYTISAGTEVIDSVITTNQTHTFDDLPSGDYTISILVNNTNCEFISDTITIENQEKFTVSASTTGTTCGLNNGYINVELFSGTTELTYPFTVVLTNTLNGQLIYQSLISTDNFLIDGVYSNNYTLSIMDNNSCTINTNIDLTGTTPIDISTYVYDCDENGGNAEVVINEIDSPYTITWKDEGGNIILTGETYISGLTNGTYNVYIEDSNGCEEIERVVISCDIDSQVSSGIVYNTICEQTFITEANSQYTFEMMLADALQDFMSGNDIPEGSYNAVFTAIIEITGPNVNPPIYIELPFHISSSINSSPTNEQWVSAVETLISQINGLESYEVTDETYFMIGECNNEMLNGALVQLSLDISVTLNEFDIDGGDFNNIEGIFEIEFDLGTYTGSVTMTFDAKDVPDRLMIEYNGDVVADSLFVGDYLNSNFYTFYSLLITAESQRTVYSWDSENETFVNTGQQVTTNYTLDDIASTTDTRIDGSVGNQLGVVAGYPTDTSSSADGDVKLTFNKTTQQPTNIKATIIGASSTEWTLNFDM